MTDNAISLLSVTERTTTLIEDILARNARARTFTVDEALVDVGLTSLDLVNLMIAVEAEFDVTIPPDQLNLENFFSTAAVARMVFAILTRSDVLKVA